MNEYYIYQSGEVWTIHIVANKLPTDNPEITGYQLTPLVYHLANSKLSVTHYMYTHIICTHTIYVHTHTYTHIRIHKAQTYQKRTQRKRKTNKMKQAKPDKKTKKTKAKPYLNFSIVYFNLYFKMQIITTLLIITNDIVHYY